MMWATKRTSYENTEGENLKHSDYGKEARRSGTEGDEHPLD